MTVYTVILEVIGLHCEHTAENLMEYFVETICSSIKLKEFETTQIACARLLALVQFEIKKKNGQI